MTVYKNASVYTGSEWVTLATAVGDSTQRTVGNVTASSYTLGVSDAGKALIFSNASSVAVQIPAESTYNFTIGQTFVLVQSGDGQITVSGAVGVTLRSLLSNVKSSGKYAELRLIKIASNEWLLSGDLTA
jgi:uncharacterized protein YaiE (UPF0345 family)